jgi:hypothetical protein
MKQSSYCLAAVLATFFLAGTHINTLAELKHRYSFNNEANDSVGTAHGVLQGGAAVFGGTLDLNPGFQSYVDLPSGIIDGFEALTVEAWATLGVNPGWVRLFDFGDTNPENNLGRNYLFFSPRSGPNDTRLVISDADPGFNNEQMANVPGNLDERENAHIVAVVDPPNAQMRIYLDGVLAGTREDLTIPLSAIVNNFSYIGRSLYPDPYLDGFIHEFRIYDHALTIGEVAANHAEGPDSVGTVSAGAVVSLAAEAEPSLIPDTINPVRVFADFENFTGIEVTREPGVELESGDPNVLQIAGRGSILAMEPGATTLTIRYGGQETVLNVEVQDAPLPSAVLKHRYSFEGEPFSAAPVVDSVSGADGTLEGWADYTGDGQVELDSQDGFESWVDLPNGIISALTDASFETWVTFAGAPGAWQRIFDFGNNSNGEDAQGTGTTYLFLTPRVGTAGVMRFAATLTSAGGEVPVLNAPFTLPSGVESHVTVTYSYSTRQARLFYNGRLLASGPVEFPLSSIEDVNNWLARSNWPDAGFTGLFNEFRIYEGVLSPLQVAVNFAAGPEDLVAETGDLVSLTLEREAGDLFPGGLGVPLTLSAQFSAISGVDITTLPQAQIESSRPEVATVTATGQLQPLAEGQTVITATYGGQQATLTVNVGPVDGPELAAAISNGNLVVRWPAAAGGQLQQTPALQPGAAWTNVAEEPEQTEGFFEVTLPLTGEARFFRLVQ